MLADPHQIPTGSKQCACEKLESVVAIGLHKQTFPKSTYVSHTRLAKFFFFHVTAEIQQRN